MIEEEAPVVRVPIVQYLAHVIIDDIASEDILEPRRLACAEDLILLTKSEDVVLYGNVAGDAYEEWPGTATVDQVLLDKDVGAPLIIIDSPTAVVSVLDVVYDVVADASAGRD